MCILILLEKPKRATYVYRLDRHQRADGLEGRLLALNLTRDKGDPSQCSQGGIETDRDARIIYM